jgi:hypothetical protein
MCLPTVTLILSTMLHTSLSPKSANARVLKKKKTFRKELSPHKCSIIEGMHLASISNYKISHLTQMPESIVQSTIQLLSSRLKRKSLPRSDHPFIVNKVIKCNIIRYCRKNPKATYATVKRELALDCSFRTIIPILKKQEIKN